MAARPLRRSRRRWALAGPTGRGNEVTIYARRQDVVLRLTAYSAQGDPTADALAVVKRMLAK